MVTESHDQRMAAWRAFLQAHATLVRVLEQEMEAGPGLPLAWYDVLAHLDHAPEGRLRMQTLAESVVLSRSGLTRLVDRMDKAKLVARETCPHDRRGVYAVITQEGVAALRRAMPGHLQGVQEHFLRHLDEEDSRALFKALSKVLRAEGGEGERDSRPNL